MNLDLLKRKINKTAAILSYTLMITILSGIIAGSLYYLNMELSFKPFVYISLLFGLISILLFLKLSKLKKKAREQKNS